MYNLFLGVLLSLLFVPAAFAKSACDNPKDDFDNLYCLNKVYIQADRDLNKTYARLVKRLDKEGKALLKESQTAWIKERNNTCSRTDADGFFINLGCAKRLTVERIQFLENRIRECVSTGCQNSKLLNVKEPDIE